ncbi:hypothetical protein EV361DRAFT_957073 [Lentinula raphanica]|nr:hypothetical protein EV361DRAFT_957073 [Lentinula raphanica]
MSARLSSHMKLRSDLPPDFHSNTLVEYPPFGFAYLPFLTFSNLSAVSGSSDYQKYLNRLFPALPSLNCSAKEYSYVDNQTSKLQELSRQLSSVTRMKNTFISSISQHSALPSDNLALVVLGNLLALRNAILTKKASIETSWWKFLDKNPEKAQTLLNSLMREIRACPDEFWKALPNITYHDFSTLAPGRWLNDEIINHFIDKWCSQKRNTLGFTTFFAGCCLFQDKTTCRTAKSLLTAADEAKIRRFVKRRQVRF